MAIASQIIAHQLDLLRVEAGLRTKSIRLLNQMTAELTARIRSSATLTDFTKARINSLLSESRTAMEDYYAQAQEGAHAVLSGVAKNTAKETGSLIEDAVAIDLSAGLPTATYLERIVDNTMIKGAPSADWWARQNADAAFRFTNAVRQGLVAGDTNEQIASRVTSVMEVPKVNARALIHTSIQAIASEARRETYQKNDDIIEGIRQLSTLDSHTSDICIAYDGAEFSLDGEPINGTTLPYDGGVPRHWGCRSVEIPITKTFQELGVDAPEAGSGERASGDGPVTGSFEDWLSSRTEEQQDEQLGAGRAEMWRDGKITLSQLLDMKGNPLTLDQLERKYD